MIKLNKIKISDIGKLNCYRYDNINYDNDYLNQYLWQKKYNTNYFIFNKYLFVVYIINNEYHFAPPICKLSTLKDYIDIIKNNFKNKKCEITLLENQYNYLLKNKYASNIIEELSIQDYIYDSKELASFEGTKFQDKRNLVNQFKQYKYEFKQYNKSFFTQAILFLNEWQKEKKMEKVELDAITMCLKKYKEFRLNIYVIIIDNEVVALSVNKCYDKYYDTYIEKANVMYKGIYAAIVNLVAKELCNKYQYCNREDDLGIDGLRKSKMSYNPIYKIRKWQMKLFNNKL